MKELMDKEYKANDMQVGGTHYRSSYQHWDLALEIPYSYLEAAATKYVTRHKKKGGPEDLKKALHYTNKLQEDGNYQARALKHPEILFEIDRFAVENDLSALERRFCEVLGTWEAKSELDEARQIIFQLLDEAEGVSPVPLEDSNKHADRV